MSAAATAASPTLRLTSRTKARRAQRLAVIPDLAILSMPDGLGVQIRGLGERIVVRGRDVEPALAFLLARLDGHATKEELLRNAPRRVYAQTLRACLSLLEAAGVVVPFKSVAHAIDAGVTNRATLYGSRRAAPANDNAAHCTPQRRIASARVTLIATGLFGRATEELLRELGCARVRTLGWDDGSTDDDAPDPDHVRLPTTSIPDAMDTLRAWIADSSLVVSATRHAPDALLAAINGACLEARVPFLRANESTALDVGPTVLPFASACFACVCARAASSDALAIEERLYQEHLARERPAGQTKPRGEYAPIARLGASLVTCEVARILSGGSPPMLENTVASVSLREGTLSHETIVRVPRCAACGDAKRREVRPAPSVPAEVRHA